MFNVKCNGGKRRKKIYTNSWSASSKTVLRLNLWLQKLKVTGVRGSEHGVIVAFRAVPVNEGYAYTAIENLVNI
jgi:hypothetical protein